MTTDQPGQIDAKSDQSSLRAHVSLLALSCSGSTSEYFTFSSSVGICPSGGPVTCGNIGPTVPTGLETAIINIQKLYALGNLTGK